MAGWNDTWIGRAKFAYGFKRLLVAGGSLVHRPA